MKMEAFIESSKKESKINLDQEQKQLPEKLSPKIKTAFDNGLFYDPACE